MKREPRENVTAKRGPPFSNPFPPQKVGARRFLPLRKSRFMHRVALAACAVVLAATGCDASSIDPTEASFDVHVANGMGIPITLVQCHDTHCNDLGDSFKVAPTHVATVGAAADTTNAYVVEASHRRLGCLVLSYRTKPQSHHS